MKTILLYICISSCVLASACVSTKCINNVPFLFSETMTSDLLCRIKSQEVARLLITLNQTHHPYIDLKKAEIEDVLEFVEYLLLPDFNLSAVKHPTFNCRSMDKTQYVTFHAEWASYLKILCCLSEEMNLHLCISSDGKVLTFTKMSNLQDVYYVQIKNSSDFADFIYEVRSSGK